MRTCRPSTSSPPRPWGAPTALGTRPLSAWMSLSLSEAREREGHFTRLQNWGGVLSLLNVAEPSSDTGFSLASRAQACSTTKTALGVQRGAGSRGVTRAARESRLEKADLHLPFSGGCRKIEILHRRLKRRLKPPAAITKIHLSRWAPTKPPAPDPPRALRRLPRGAPTRSRGGEGAAQTGRGLPSLAAHR